MDKENKNLYYLDELSDYKIVSDKPDVRGWKVFDKDQRCIGEVDNLLVSKSAERVVYLDVEVDKSIIEANHMPYSSASENEGVHEFLNKDGENHLIIPIGLVSLDEDSEKIYSDRVDYKTFAETKRKEKNRNVDREYELWVLESYNREAETFPSGDKLYEDDNFKERNR